MLEFLGRLHPLVLHLPVGVLAFSAILELYYWKSKNQAIPQVQSLTLLVAGLTAIISVVTGLLLTRNGDYSGDLVNNHKWVAIVLMVSSWILYWMHQQKIKKDSFKKPYSIAMVFSLILLIITGHLGGSITHGENFLFESNEPQFTANIEEALLYEDIIAPILKSKCLSCHNPTKLKGDLDLTSIELIIESGGDENIILIDDPLESPLIKRVHLPLSNEDHMPPEGKKQLSGDEISLIEWWLKSGANFDQNIQEAEGFAEHKTVAEKFLAPPVVSVFGRVERIGESTFTRLLESEIKAEHISQDDAAVYVNLKNSTLNKSPLKKLRKISQNVAHLNLSDSDLSDKLMGNINRYKNLKKLELQNTNVSSTGINNLKKLNYLTTLNLYNTNVDSTCIDKLLSFPQLQYLYLWETNMTDKNIEYLASQKPRLNIIYDINKDIFTDAALKPPLINTSADIFTDSMEVSLDLNFKGVNIYYTLDGIDPDSTAILYTKPFKVGNSLIIKAKAMKEAWESSEIAERQVVKAGVKIDQFKLHNPTHSRYADIGSKKLGNLKFGTTLFSDGEWIGFEGSHSRMTARLEKEAEIGSIAVGALESSGSYIFYPQKIEVLTSRDGKRFELVAESEYPIAEQSEGVKRKNFVLEFEKHKARWVKINVLSHLKNPDWHPAPGAKCWIFIDEIIIN